jgi:ketosteroid isomerase-like protein
MAAFNRRDIDSFMQPATSDFEWFPAMGATVEGGSFQGREGVERYFEELRETFEEIELVVEEGRDLAGLILPAVELRVEP